MIIKSLCAVWLLIIWIYCVRVPLVLQLLARWLGEWTLPDTPVHRLGPFIGVAILSHWTRPRLMALHLPVPLAYTLGVAASFIVCILSLWCHFAPTCWRLLLHIPRLLILTLCWWVALVLAPNHFLLGVHLIVCIAKPWFWFMTKLFLLLISLFGVYLLFECFSSHWLVFLVFISSVMLRCFSSIRLLLGFSTIGRISLIRCFIVLLICLLESWWLLIWWYIGLLSLWLTGMRLSLLTSESHLLQNLILLLGLVRIHMARILLLIRWAWRSVVLPLCWQAFLSSIMLFFDRCFSCFLVLFICLCLPRRASKTYAASVK